MSRSRWVAIFAVLALVAGACGTATATPPAATAPPTAPPAPTAEPAATPEPTPSGPVMRSISAPAAAITVDGNPSDWNGIAGLDLTLEGIQGVEVPVESKEATIRVAHDDRFVYLLFEVQDDYDWNAEDAHVSGASAVMWAVLPEAGAHMGPEDPEGKGPSLGMVDIWHWELECAAGEQSGGEVSDPGSGKPGNDSGCNFDDEWATSPEDREDDNANGAENSLLGVWSHTNPSDDGAGTWVFEIRRPLQTGDEQDAQFAVGSPSMMALAYWDADQTPSGWEDDGHSQSSNQGWIQVTLE
jgi:hypothetical protein